VLHRSDRVLCTRKNLINPANVPLNPSKADCIAKTDCLRLFFYVSLPVRRMRTKGVRPTQDQLPRLPTRSNSPRTTRLEPGHANTRTTRTGHSVTWKLHKNPLRWRRTTMKHDQSHYSGTSFDARSRPSIDFD
jgi:hypothetical protein